MNHERHRSYPTPPAAVLGRVAPLLAASLAALAGCANPDNDRLTLDGAAQRPWNAEPVSTPARGPALAQATQPSVSDGSRSHWPEVVAGTGGDAVEHHEPVAPLSPRYTNATARQRGEFPTTATAFEVGGDTGAQVAEGFAAPFHAAFDILAMLPRAIGGAGRASRSAGESFVRAADHAADTQSMRSNR